MPLLLGRKQIGSWFSQIITAMLNMLPSHNIQKVHLCKKKNVFSSLFNPFIVLRARCNSQCICDPFKSHVWLSVFPVTCLRATCDSQCFLWHVWRVHVTLSIFWDMFESHMWLSVFLVTPLRAIYGSQATFRMR